MRLRRLELVVIAVTVIFAVFMGGFFTGRSWSAVNISPVAAQSGGTQSVGVSIQSLEAPVPVAPDSSAATSGHVASTDTIASAVPAADTPQVPQENHAPDTPPEAPGAPRGGDGKININIATQSELTDLPGIGNTLASRIVDHRRQHGDFQRIEDIRNVSGIGEKRYEAIEHMITVG